MQMTIDNDLQDIADSAFPQETDGGLINDHDEQYHDLLREILEYGEKRGDRTGTGTISIFGANMMFDMEDSFPLITTKKIHWPSVVHELLWFISGDTNIKYLQDNGVKIWNQWADENGNLGPVYGAQWRNFGRQASGEVHVRGIDQLANVIERIKTNPECRRLIVSAWNPVDLPKMALPPCHMFFQFYVREGQFLDCQMYQRSADSLLGVPFNIASYSLLTMMVAHVTGLKAGNFHHCIGDAHIYLNHIEQVNEQLTRTSFDPPTVKLNPDIKNIFDFKFEDIILENYQSHAGIKAPIAV